MKFLSFPSLINDELLLEWLKRKSLAIAYEQPVLQNSVRQLIFTLHKVRVQ
ncbi:MAG: DUF5340 family protein [cyanobacterium endosymbiont of Rhopalodia sterrenbergii]